MVHCAKKRIKAEVRTVLKQDPLSFLGESFEFQDSREETMKNIKLIIRIRFFVTPSIFIIMFIAGLFGYTRESAFSENQIIVNGINLVVMLLLNGTYMLLVRKMENLRPLVIFQLMIDIVHYSLTVYKTGGGTSPFTFLYLMVIFSGAMLVTSKTAYLMAGITACAFSGIVVFENIGIIPHQDFFSPYSGLDQERSYLLLSWIFTVFSLFAFAALAGYLIGLSQKKQRQLARANVVMKKKNETMLLLYRTSKALNNYNSVRDVVNYILQELLQHLRLDRSLLYLNIKEEFLHLYMVKTREKDGRVESVQIDDTADVSPEEESKGLLKVNIPLVESAGLTAICALKQKSYNIQEPEKSTLINIELAKKIGMNPFAMSPLLLRGKTIGVIGIDRSFENGSITEEEFKILQMFANQAAITIHSLIDQDNNFLA